MQNIVRFNLDNVDEQKKPGDKKGFRWSIEPNRRAESIIVSSDGTVASRPSAAGKNPSVLATEPLTSERSHFRVRVVRLGQWIGIGVADSSFVVSGSAVLGSQTAVEGSIGNNNQSQANRMCINSSYFCQTSAKIRVAGGKMKRASHIHSGDIVDVAVELDTANRRLKFFYWLNETLQGCVESFIDISKLPPIKDSHHNNNNNNTNYYMTSHSSANELTLERLELYPCVCLSSETSVEFRSDHKPRLYMAIEKTEEDPWKWATTPDKKATAIQLSKDSLSCSRVNSESRNPSVMTSLPLTKKNPHFRVQVTRLGNWIGIGVADMNFVIQDNVVLGSQTGSINSSYFCQNTCKIRMYGEEMKDVSRANSGDIVDVAVDFENDNIFYWLNEKLQGHISCKNHHLTEGELYPIVNLSAATEVMLRVNDKPTLYMPIERQKESKKELVLEAKGGSLHALRIAMENVGNELVQEAKNDMLFAALQGYKSKVREKNYHEVALPTRKLIFLAHMFDSQSMFYLLPREILYYIFELGAMQFQHFEIIRHLVLIEEANVDEIMVNSCQHYPFAIACEIGNLELLRLLIDHGATIDDMKGQKAIYGAINGARAAIANREIGRITRFVNVFFFLINDCQVKPDMEVLICAAQTGDLNLVKFLVEEHHIAPKVVDGTFSPLMAAAKEGHLHILEYLLCHGAAETVLGRFEQTTARDLAKDKGYTDIVKTLKKYEDRKSTFGRVRSFLNIFKQ